VNFTHLFVNFWHVVNVMTGHFGDLTLLAGQQKGHPACEKSFFNNS